MSTNSDSPKAGQHLAQDAIMPDQSTKDAANKFCRDHWNDGLRLAGADSNYIAYWAFCAGARSRVQGGTPSTDTEAVKHRVYDWAEGRYTEMQIVPADFARQLERERDEYLRMYWDEVKAQAETHHKTAAHGGDLVQP